MPSSCCPTRPVLFLSGLLLLLAACSHSAPDGDGEVPPVAAVEASPEPTPEPTPEPAAEPVTEELSISPDELTLIADKGVLEYCLDCRRKASTYNYCEFEKSEFEAAVGEANMSKTLTLEVQMVEQATNTYVPDDPSAPQPHGGFSHVRHDCTVKSVVSAE